MKYLNGFFNTSNGVRAYFATKKDYDKAKLFIISEYSF